MAWSQSQRKYAQSEKGKLARKKYQESPKGIEARKRYFANRKAKKTENKIAETVVADSVKIEPETSKIKKEVRNKK